MLFSRWGSLGDEWFWVGNQRGVFELNGTYLGFWCCGRCNKDVLSGCFELDFNAQQREFFSFDPITSKDQNCISHTGSHVKAKLNRRAAYYSVWHTQFKLFLVARPLKTNNRITMFEESIQKKGKRKSETSEPISFFSASSTWKVLL